MTKIYIAGFRDVSLVDYPEDPAFVVWFTGCNFRCIYCYNYHLWEQKPEQKIDMEKLVNTIKHATIVVSACKVTGGEPTLQPEGLIKLGIEVKNLGLKYGIDTNATNPNIISKLIYSYDCLDAISIDIKAPLTVREYSRISGINITTKTIEEIKKTIKIALESPLEYVELRIPVAKTINDKIEKLKAIENELIELGYLDAKCKRKLLVLFEILTEKGADKNLRKVESIKPHELCKLAGYMKLPGIVVRHRKLGTYVPLSEAIKTLK